jgi:hypothetical protein
MDWFKIIILPLSVLITSLILYGLEHYYHDKRTTKNKNLRTILLIALFSTAILNGFFIYSDQKNSTASYQTIVDKMNNDSIQNAARHLESVSQRDSLNSELHRISENLKPFVEISRQKYPNRSTEVGLQKLVDELSEIKKTTDKIESKVKSRHLSSTSASYIAKELSSIKSETIQLQFDPTDIEAKNYANELKQAIQSGGWVVNDFQLMSLQPSPGIMIYCRDSEESQKISNSLWFVLNKTGVYKSRNIGLSDSGGDWIVNLYIGPNYKDY